MEVEYNGSYCSFATKQLHIHNVFDKSCRTPHTDVSALTVCACRACALFRERHSLSCVYIGMNHCLPKKRCFFVPKNATKEGGRHVTLNFVGFTVTVSRNKKSLESYVHNEKVKEIFEASRNRAHEMYRHLP